MKKIFLFFIFLFILFSNLYGDETTDIQSDSIEKESNEKVKIPWKFRGTVSFVVTYYFACHDGVSNDNHFSPIDYDPLDYTDKGDPDNDHHIEDDNGRVINYTGTELKLYIKYDFIAPFLNYNYPLLKGNNIKFSVLGEISPISTNIGGEVTFTPIAFLYFQSGFLIGSAWHFVGLAAGLGLSTEDGIYKFEYAGPHLQLWFATTFQIDLAYLLPEKFQRWTHIVMFITPRLKYQALLSVTDDEPYMYEADRGMNFNGWKFSCEFFLGYQMDIIEDDDGQDRQFIKMRNNDFTITTGLFGNIEKLDITHYNRSRMKDKGWGSDFVTVEFGPIIKFDLPWNYYLTLFAFFATDREYTSDTVGNIDFRKREYEDWYIHFRRIGLFFGWQF
jgi:hypothetical protein